MSSVNKVFLIGNLGQDPKTSVGVNGKTYCSFSLATTDKFKGEERTEWHNIVLFDRVAEIADQYLSKGRQVYIEGRLQTNKYQDKETGQDRQRTVIIGQTLQMLGSRPTNHVKPPNPPVWTDKDRNPDPFDELLPEDDPQKTPF